MLLDDVFEFKLVWKSKNPQNVSAVKSAGRVEWFPRGLLAMVLGPLPATRLPSATTHNLQLHWVYWKETPIDPSHETTNLSISDRCGKFNRSCTCGGGRVCGEELQRTGWREHGLGYLVEREGTVGSRPGRGRGEGVKVPQRSPPPPSAGLSASHLVPFLWEQACTLMVITLASQAVGGGGIDWRSQAPSM